MNTSGVICTLFDKKLITTAGRKEVMGRPILYKSSKEFLMRFGLSDLDELPSLKEFEALAREALGTDEGIAPSESTDEALLNSPSADTLENLPAPECSANVFAATHRDAASSLTQEATASIQSEALADATADPFCARKKYRRPPRGCPPGNLTKPLPFPTAKPPLRANKPQLIWSGRLSGGMLGCLARDSRFLRAGFWAEPDGQRKTSN